MFPISFSLEVNSMSLKSSDDHVLENSETSDATKCVHVQ